jgi:hypothetical protein
MVTNITINPIDGDSIVYLQDGSSYLVESGETYSLQIIEHGICTISDVGSDADASEHPPEWFVDAMQNFADLMRAALQDPHVEPY